MKEKKKREREAKTTAKPVGKFYLEGNDDGQRRGGDGNLQLEALNISSIHQAIFKHFPLTRKVIRFAS